MNLNREPYASRLEGILHPLTPERSELVKIRTCVFTFPFLS